MTSIAVGTIIDGRYKIIRQLGEGGMGSVFLASERELNRQVALKFLQPDLITDQEQRTRFEQEGKILSALHHHNILTVYRFGIWNRQTPFIAMEYLEGSSLKELIDNTRIAPALCLQIAIQTAQALSYAHKEGIVHRDIKPTNVWIQEDRKDLVKILDFGLARILDSARSQRLTQTGDLIGSAFYMSPEQCTGKTADPRSDIYSLGCVIFEMLEGRPPFVADNPIALLHKHTQEAPPKVLALAESGIEATETLASFNLIIGKCLEKLPQNRYQTMDSLLRDLRLLQQNRIDEIAEHSSKRTNTPSTKARIAAALIPLLFAVTALALVAFFAPQKHPPIHKTSNPPLQRSQHSPIGLTSQLNTSLNHESGQNRYLELKGILEKIDAGQRPDNVDLPKLYLAYCADAEKATAQDSEDVVVHLTRLLSRQEATPFSEAVNAKLWDYLARHQLRLRQYPQAEAAARKSLELFSSVSGLDPTLKAYALQTLCKAQRYQWKLVNNSKSLTQSLRIAHERNQPLAVALLAPELAYELLLKGEIERETKLFHDSLASTESGIASEATQYIHNMFDVLSMAGKTSLLKTYLPAWVAASTRAAPASAASVNFQAGQYLLDGGMPVDALPYLGKAQALLKPNTENQELQNALSCTKARALTQLGRSRESTLAVAHSIATASQSNYRNMMALALCCIQNDDLRNAEDVLAVTDGALAAHQIGPAEFAMDYRLLIEHLNLILREKKELEYAERCKRLIGSNLDSPQWALAALDVNRAHWYTLKQNYVQGQNIINSVLPSITKAPLTVQVDAYQIAVCCALHRGNVKEAQALFNKATQLLLTAASGHISPNIYQRFADCYEATGRLTDCEKIIRKPLESLHTSEAERFYTVSNLCSFYTRHEKASSALPLIAAERALNTGLLRTKADNISWSLKELRTGSLCRSLNRTREAATHFTTALKLANRVDNNINSITILVNLTDMMLDDCASDRQAWSKYKAQVKEHLSEIHANPNSSTRGVADIIPLMDAKYCILAGQTEQANNFLAACKKASQEHPIDRSPANLRQCAVLYANIDRKPESESCRILAQDLAKSLHLGPYQTDSVLRRALESWSRVPDKNQ